MAVAADSAAASGDNAGALSAWREALMLLPADSRQHRLVSDKIAELSSAVDKAAVPQPASRGGRAAGIGALGLLIWKLKAVIFVLLTKVKLLALGLTKLSTLFSMLLSLGVYWEIW